MSASSATNNLGVIGGPEEQGFPEYLQEGATYANMRTLAGDYVVRGCDSVLVCDASKGDVSVQLPAGDSGRVLEFTSFGSNNVYLRAHGDAIVNPRGGEPECSEILLREGAGVKIMCTGTMWCVMAESGRPVFI